MAKKPSKAAKEAEAVKPAAQAAAPDAAPQLSPEEMGQLRTRNTAAAFGEAVAALLRSPAHRGLTLADLENTLVPALVNGQFVIGHAAIPNRPGESIPAAIMLWATVSDEVDAQLKQQTSLPLRIERNQWRTGEHVWIIDAAGPAEALTQLVAEFEASILKGKTAKRPASSGI
jgi:hemolysin-activating ACP:hemolysin acyltransferase